MDLGLWCCGDGMSVVGRWGGLYTGTGAEHPPFHELHGAPFFWHELCIEPGLSTAYGQEMRQRDGNPELAARPARVEVMREQVATTTLGGQRHHRTRLLLD